jgi:hypothetical protein
LSISDRDQFKKDDYQRMYNSILILGEYFHRFRLRSGSPIRVLASFLLKHLTDELIEQMEASTLSPVFAELIFNQITLNGLLFEQKLRPDINKLLLVIRKCLINLPNLEISTRTYLLMTLDLFYCKFGRMDVYLEEMYVKFLLDSKKSESNGEEVKTIFKSVETVESDKTTVASESERTAIEAAPVDNVSEEQPLVNVAEETKKSDELFSHIPTIVTPAENCDAGTTKEMPKLKSAEEIDRNLNIKGYKLYKKKKNTESSSNNSSNDSSSDHNNSKSDLDNESTTFNTNAENLTTPADCDSSDVAWPIDNLSEIDQNNYYTITRLDTQDTTNEVDNFNKNRFQRGNKKLTSNGNSSKGKSRSSDSQRKNQQKSDKQNDTPRFTVHKDKKTNGRLSSSSNNGTNTNQPIPPSPKNVYQNYNITNYLQSQQTSGNRSPPNNNHCNRHKAAYFKEENVENLTWDVNYLDLDEGETSPKAINPHTKSFLSFLKQN